MDGAVLPGIRPAEAVGGLGVPPPVVFDRSLVRKVRG